MNNETNGTKKNSNAFNSREIEKESKNKTKRKSFLSKLKKFSLLFIILLVFYTIAITLWLAKDSLFYLVNFLTIGNSLGLGIGLWPILPKKKKHLALKLSQLLVGGYMFFGLGFGLIYLAWGYIHPENMQLEGFWFLLLAGSFTGAVIHYTIAKIVGPLLFNRSWCSWACWTSAVLDLLPWKKSPGRKRKWGYIRYGLFGFSVVLVLILVFGFGYRIATTSLIVDLPFDTSINPLLKSFLIHEFWWFIIGNLIYFLSGILLAAALRDNRAFCKYLCPITPIMKLFSRASLTKIELNKDLCIECGACERACPMDIKILDYAKDNKRVTSSECIFCLECVCACPKEALSITLGLDIGFKELLSEQPIEITIKTDSGMESSK